jgi:hypothetical protein
MLNIADIETDVNLANEILVQVAEGYYLEELILQLPWAYQIHQFEGAVKDCSKYSGNFLDSSKYDNCDGIPRYENEGLVEWWKDLKVRRNILNEQLSLRSGMKGSENLFFENQKSAYFQLEQLAVSGDDAKLLAALIERKVFVEAELEKYRAR